MTTKNSSDKTHMSFSVDKDHSNIQVCVRMRPLLEPYEDEISWEVDYENKTIKTKPDLKASLDITKLKAINLAHTRHYSELFHQQSFTFDNVEGPEVKTKDIYTKLCKRLVVSTLQGYNGTVFMYGQTTSGKTYSMLGTAKDPGILPHSMRTLFTEIEKSEEYDYHVYVSYLEIYNETINDLLVPGSTGLKVLDDPKYGVIVKGLKRQRARNFDEALYLMNYGEEHRMYRETNFHEHSSRSHTIYQVFIESGKKSESDNERKKIRYSCLNLVDLAGSERLTDTDQYEGHVEETGYINKSLFLLTNLIKRLAEEKPQTHYPYRDSKLTRILSNALGGNSLTTIVCTVSPALMNYSQTLSTLRFASRAKRVKNKPQINEMDRVEVHHQLKNEIKYLLERLHQSENEISKVNNINNKLEDNLQMTKMEIQHLQKDFEELKSVFVRESFKQPDGNPDTSDLDTSHDGQKQKLRQGLSGEFFFGDPFIMYVEQALSEGQIMSSTSEASSEKMNILRDWGVQSLRAKHSYLRELRKIQQRYIEGLVTESMRFVDKNNVNVVTEFGKNYIRNELGKNEVVASRIAEALKKYDESEVSSPETNERGAFNYDYNGNDKNPRSYYDDVLHRIEQKYDEVCKLATQSLKSRESSVLSEPSMPEQKPTDYSYYTGRDDPYSRELDSPLPGLRLSDSSRQTRSEGGGFIMRSPLASPKLDSLLKQRQERGSISVTHLSVPSNAYLWGSGKDGRLGNGKYSNEPYPVPISDIRFSEIVCGHHNTFGISQEGLVYAWGRNEIGQLGVGNYKNSPLPINVFSLNNQKIVHVACGWQHCIALTIDGRMFSWGCGDDGQLGHGDSSSSNTPKEVRFFEKMMVTQICCGHSQSAAITSIASINLCNSTDENELYTWGHNSDYRIMNSNPRNHPIPSLTEFHKIKNKSSDFEIVSISMGVSHMCIVTRNGMAFTAGRGNEGQLGRRLVEKGENTITYRPEPEKEDDSEEKLCSFFCEVQEFGQKNKAVMAACGEKFTLILNNQRQVYSFGDASDGCLGLETSEKEKIIDKPTLVVKLEDKRVIGISAGPRHTACITDEGELYCWGFNYYDQLGVGETQKNYHIPKKVDKLSGQKVISVSCGHFHTASLVN